MKGISSMGDTAESVRIEVFSDYACPFCYIGKWDIDRLAEQVDVEVCWRPFELRPEGTPLPDPDGEYLRNAWANVFRLAAERGIEIRRPSCRPRTRLALEAAEYARAQSKFGVFHDAVFRAFFVDDRDIGEVDVLCTLARECGLDADELAEHLAKGTFRSAVEQSTEDGRQRGVEGVPTFFIGNECVEGAEGVEALLGACRLARPRGRMSGQL